MRVVVLAGLSASSSMRVISLHYMGLIFVSHVTQITPTSFVRLCFFGSSTYIVGWMQFAYASKRVVCVLPQFQMTTMVADKFIQCCSVRKQAVLRAGNEDQVSHLCRLTHTGTLDDSRSVLARRI